MTEKAPVQSAVDSATESIIETKNGDVALGRFQHLKNIDEDASKEIDKRLLRKVDWFLLPIMAFTAFLQFLDKVSLNFAAGYGMTKELHLVGDQYSWTASIFYFGYLAFSIPTNILVQKLPLSKYLCTCIVLWGLILAASSKVTDFKGLMVARFFMGCLEATILPSFNLINTMYYTRDEQSFRASVWFNGMAGVLGGLLAFGIGKINNPHMSDWRFIFLIYGVFTTAWGFVLFFVIPDNPLKAWWLTEEEKSQVVLRVSENQTGLENKHFKWEQARELLSDPKIWILFVFSFAANIPNGALNAFSTIIIGSFKFEKFQAILLNIPGGAVLLLSVCFFCYFPTRFKNCRTTAGAIGVVPALVGTIILTTTSRDHKGVSLFAFYLMYFFNTAFVMSLSLASSNFAGHTKKVLTNAIIFTAYCGGNIAGPFFFKTSQSPKYQLGIGATMFCFALQIVLLMVFQGYVRWENKRRDTLYGIPEEIDERTFLDLTDMENKSFRYVY